MDPKKSICVKEWKPFPDPVSDPKKMAEIQAEACKNYFGKNDCMQKEITENCGPAMWVKMRKYYLDLNKLNGPCSFD
ncbi:hypothetical protein GCK72_018937 [Caenorhabditis remanei]|uniref:T20D4.11-like domain-containing protein n=1 Tax=Caenorhabditis remanei TaxID=31234 RepID=A0A6A5GD59_CAERE|nr:hypothetical protein GCK72_018937 [Caenorhabditis remanei]KAF1752382.1 hypothetical protein GCK72_018937 [Caenorhabditis remanei]